MAKVEYFKVNNTGKLSQINVMNEKTLDSPLDRDEFDSRLGEMCICGHEMDEHHWIYCKLEDIVAIYNHVWGGRCSASNCLCDEFRDGLPPVEWAWKEWLIV